MYLLYISCRFDFEDLSSSGETSAELPPLKGRALRQAYELEKKKRKKFEKLVRKNNFFTAQQLALTQFERQQERSFVQQQLVAATYQKKF